MAMRPVTDHASQAARINPEHIPHVTCYTNPRPADPAIPERMDVGLAGGTILTFCYRTPGDVRRAASSLDTEQPSTGATTTRVALTSEDIECITLAFEAISGSTSGDLVPE